MQTAAINHGDVGRSHPVKYTFAPYLAYIRQIRETWIHSWVIRLERTFGSHSHFLMKSATCSTLFSNSHLPNPIASLCLIHYDAPSQTLPSDALTGLGHGSGLRWRLWRAPTRRGWRHTKQWSPANRLRNRCAWASIQVRHAAC